MTERYNLLEALDNPFIAVTGRVRSYLEKRDKGLYPVSCTMIHVKDTCYNEDDPTDLETIFGSWQFVGRAIKGAAGCAVDLSDVRPKGSPAGRTGVASGPVSFMRHYSQINDTIRRGGAYRNGACVIYLDSNHPDFEEFMDYGQLPDSPDDPTYHEKLEELKSIAWIKRSCYVDDETLKNKPLVEKIMQRVQEGTLWLAKKRWNKSGERLYFQICHEISLKSTSTCNLTHVNLGQILDIGDLVPAFEQTMTFLCELFWQTELPSHYIDKKLDKQVGMGVVGLANMLAHFGVTYEDFVTELEYLLGIEEPLMFEEVNTEDLTAHMLANEVKKGFEAAAKIAKSYGMERAFTIAPTATVSYNHCDVNGFTCTPEISPPTTHPDSKGTTTSNSVQQRDYKYPPNVEVAHHDVPFDIYYRLAKCWQLLMDIECLSHAISFNSWSPGFSYDYEGFKDWYESPLWTLYYSLNVDQTAQDKTSIQMEVTPEETEFWSSMISDDRDGDSVCHLADMSCCAE